MLVLLTHVCNPMRAFRAMFSSEPGREKTILMSNSFISTEVLFFSLLQKAPWAQYIRDKSICERNVRFISWGISGTYILPSKKPHKTYFAPLGFCTGPYVVYTTVVLQPPNTVIYLITKNMSSFVMTTQNFRLFRQSHDFSSGFCLTYHMKKFGTAFNERPRTGQQWLNFNWNLQDNVMFLKISWSWAY